MATKVPAYTFTGMHESEVRDGYWYIYLWEPGTFRCSYAKNAEVCVVGGGAGGMEDPNNGGAGGGGGQVLSKSVSIQAGNSYSVYIGLGGQIGANGEATTGFGVTASGGIAGAGGASGGGRGANGTYPFGNSSLERYGACGGGGGATGGAGGSDGGGKGASSSVSNAVAGEPGMGAGGGGGAYNATAAIGGAGCVILRGTEDDFLPVRFNGVQLSKITFNGQAVTGLIYGGQRIFMRAVRRLWACLFGRAAYGA